MKITRLRVDNVRCHRHEAIVEVTVVSGRFDYGADHVSVEGKDILVRSYYRVQVAGMQAPTGRVINLELAPGGAGLEVGDVIRLRFE